MNTPASPIQLTADPIADPARYVRCTARDLAAQLRRARPGTRHEHTRRTSFRLGWLCGRYNQPLALHLAALRAALDELYDDEERSPRELWEKTRTLDSGASAGRDKGEHDRPAPSPPPPQLSEYHRQLLDDARRRRVDEARRSHADYARHQRLIEEMDAPGAPVELGPDEVKTWLWKVHADPSLRPSERLACVVLSCALDARGVFSDTLLTLHNSCPHLMAYDTLRKAFAVLTRRGVHLVRVRDLSATSGATYHHGLVRVGETPGEACARLCGGLAGLWYWDHGLNAWTRADTTQRRYDVPELAPTPEAHGAHRAASHPQTARHTPARSSTPVATYQEAHRRPIYDLTQTPSHPPIMRTCEESDSPVRFLAYTRAELDLYPTPGPMVRFDDWFSDSS